MSLFLEINDNLIFEKVEDETEELSNELKILLNHAIKKKEFFLLHLKLQVN